MNMTQAQLEALVDLLVYASVTDARFTLLETDVLEKTLEEMNWKSNIGLSSFVNASHARNETGVFAKTVRELHDQGTTENRLQRD
jgi:hypothetical protein